MNTFLNISETQKILKFFSKYTVAKKLLKFPQLKVQDI